MVQEKGRPSVFVANIDTAMGRKMEEDLMSQEFVLSRPPYTIFSAKKSGVSCTLYESGKLVVQGKQMKPFIEFYLEPEILKDFSFSYGDTKLDLSPRIGSDEAGKGDFFGPLCVASVYASGEAVPRLKELGVRDSKHITDRNILLIAQQIKKDYLYQVVRIDPKKYNEIYPKFGNLNSLLAWAHARAVQQLVAKSGCTSILIDQFANEKVMHSALQSEKNGLHVVQRFRAEEDLVVAAASILAKAEFLQHLEKLQSETGVPLPKGASRKVIDAGKNFVARYGSEALGRVGKLHFKTTSDVLQKGV